MWHLSPPPGANSAILDDSLIVAGKVVEFGLQKELFAWY